MDHPGTITRIIRDLEGAERPRRDDAVRELWERFFADLTVYARKRLRAMNAPMGPADEEDAASRAFMKVCRGIERGQLKLASRVDLTKMLRSATSREVFSLLSRAKGPGSGPDDDAILRQVPDPALPPDLLLLAFDACQRLLDLLETDELRHVALWKLAGHTNAAIATKLGCSNATVERHPVKYSERPGGGPGATRCRGDRRSPVHAAAPRTRPTSRDSVASMMSRPTMRTRSSATSPG